MTECELNANFYMHCRLWRGEECGLLGKMIAKRRAKA